MRLTSSGWRPEMLLNIPRCTAPSKGGWAPDVNRATAGKPYTEITSRFPCSSR